MILAVESSCDETALALVDEFGKIHFNICLSQIALHQKYGGVVPELASRSHFEVLDRLLDFISKNNIQQKDIRAVAATMGPGLIGPLLVGSSFARGLASAWEKPFIGVHHLRGHVASVLLDGSEKILLAEKAKNIFPALILLVSGGHCLLLNSDDKLNLDILKTSADLGRGKISAHSRASFSSDILHFNAAA